MATAPIIDSRLIRSEFEAGELFRGIFYATDAAFPELMEFFPEVSDNRALLNGLIAGGQRAEAEGLDIEPFVAMERIIRAYPDADYSA